MVDERTISSPEPPIDQNGVIDDPVRSQLCQRRMNHATL